MKLFNSVLVVLALNCGCANQYPYHGRDSEIGSAVVGSVIGGAIGGVVGNNVGDNDNEVLGAAIGAATGAWIGQQYGRDRDNIKHRLDTIDSMQQTVTVTVNNQNGSYTPVVLYRIGNGQYRGPRGEIYTGVPTADQLKQCGYGL